MRSISAVGPLVPSTDGSVCGYICVDGEQYPVRVRAGVTEACFESCPRLHAILANHASAVEQRLHRNTTPEAFLTELTELVERATARNIVDTPRATNQSGGELPSAAFYELLIAELDAAGWSSLLSVSPTLDEIELAVEDTAGRRHALRLSLPSDYPRSPPRAQVALPAPFDLRWPSGMATQLSPSLDMARGPSLLGALSQFRAALARHQQLWDILDDLDANTWVLEPKNPTRDCVTRRVAIGDHCSLQIELHVGSPSSLPELQFLGADRVIAPLRQALNENLALWQPERTVRVNLEAVLQRSFPSRQTSTADAEEYSVECAICYSYHLDGSVPESACDGCSKPFHKACLSEWLRGLPSTQQSFNRLFGECPYCGTNIACEAREA